MILLIDNYDSFVHNLARDVRELGGDAVVRRNDKVTPDAPLVKVGAHPIGCGTPGALTRQLADAYTALIALECGT